MLASLNPYTTFAAGELGGSLDLFYRLKTWIFHLSGTYIWTLPQALENHTVLRMGYREVNLDVEKRWTRRFKTTAFVSIQEYSPSHGERNGTDIQNVFVLDASVKVSREVTLRGQFQYLYSQELTRDWMAASLEMVTVSGWAVHVQDMYNHGDTKEHYYNVGGSWTRGGFKVDYECRNNRMDCVEVPNLADWLSFAPCKLLMSVDPARIKAVSLRRGFFILPYPILQGNGPALLPQSARLPSTLSG